MIVDGGNEMPAVPVGDAVLAMRDAARRLENDTWNYLGDAELYALAAGLRSRLDAVLASIASGAFTLPGTVYGVIPDGGYEVFRPALSKGSP